MGLVPRAAIEIGPPGGVSSPACLWQAPGDALAPLNQPCILAIRPEHVLIRQTAGNLENALPATVREINFSGATSSIKLDANGLLLEALALDVDGLSPGDQRIVVLPAERISLLKE